MTNSVAAEVIRCPNCGAGDIPMRFSQDFVPCPYCNTTIRITDRRPNTTQAYQERIERERTQRPAQSQEDAELQTLRDLARLREKARRAGAWIAALAAAIVLSGCALSLLLHWLKQGDSSSYNSLIAAGVFAAAALAAWLIERRARKRCRRSPGPF